MVDRDEHRPAPTDEVSAEDFLFHLHRGTELLEDNRVHAAKAELEQALSLQPSDPKGQDLLGIVYFRLGLYPRAITIYERLVYEHPDAVEPRINLALCYLKTGQPAQARSELEKVLEHAPNHQRAWGYLGLAHQRLGDNQRAINAFAVGGHDAMARRLTQTTVAPPAHPSGLAHAVVSAGPGSKRPLLLASSAASAASAPLTVGAEPDAAPDAALDAAPYAPSDATPDVAPHIAPDPLRDLLREPMKDEVRQAMNEAAQALDQRGFTRDSDLPRIPTGTWSALEPGREEFGALPTLREPLELSLRAPPLPDLPSTLSAPLPEIPPADAVPAAAPAAPAQAALGRSPVPAAPAAPAARTAQATQAAPGRSPVPAAHAAHAAHTAQPAPPAEATHARQTLQAPRPAAGSPVPPPLRAPPAPPPPPPPPGFGPVVRPAPISMPATRPTNHTGVHRKTLPPPPYTGAPSGASSGGEVSPPIVSQPPLGLRGSALASTTSADTAAIPTLNTSASLPPPAPAAAAPRAGAVGTAGHSAAPPRVASPPVAPHPAPAAPAAPPAHATDPAHAPAAAARPSVAPGQHTASNHHVTQGHHTVQTFSAAPPPFAAPGPGTAQAHQAGKMPSVAPDPESARTVFAQPPGTPLAFARERLLVFPRDLPLAQHASGLVLVQAQKGFATRLNAVRTLTTALGVPTKVLTRRSRGRDQDEPLGGATASIHEIGGRCELVLVPPDGLRLFPLDLADDPLYLREDALIGFELSVTYENGRLPTGDGEAVPLIQLRGRGGVVCALSERSATIEIQGGRTTVVHAGVVRGWIGRILPRALSTSEAPAGLRGMVAFSGEGMVIVDGH
ncbi:tetratricopeptide repeat protein [Chondromyces apiculatus]|uniref:Uncharacterized protein n=1 Tax=Chondromyces apiculatus DSM 436 TaxID=1192034 RepID=A0A017T798_9BACT|nr:tetratricopeptide repeat protein [Chondromyces apiculatus]EYF04675.1 Hypothetical protein CAP_4351 [Chondromyces apiculatus DSM 436]